jgi:hypothetical protein
VGRREGRLYVRNRGERGSSRGVRPEDCSCRLPSRAQVPLLERKRSEYTPGCCGIRDFQNPETASSDVPLFGSTVSPCSSEKRFVACSRWAVVMGTNGRAGSGETRARGDGDWCLVQGWPRRATTPPMCLVFESAAGVSSRWDRRRQERRVPCEWPEARSSNRTAEVS